MSSIQEYFKSIITFFIENATQLFEFIINNPIKILLYILIAYLILKIITIIFLIIRDLYIARKTKKQLGQTIATTTTFLGNVVGITGDKGAGKTTLTSAITSAFEISLSNKASEKREFIALLLKMPILHLDSIIEELMRTNDLQKTYQKQEIADKVSELLFEKLYKKNNNGDPEHLFFDDKISPKKYQDYLTDYVECFLLLRRNNFVYSNVDFYSQITGSKGYYLSNNDFKMRERFNNNDFTLRRYSVFFNDEDTLKESKNNINWQKKYKNMDGGTIEHLRLYRHLYKETSKFVSTLQHFKRSMKVYRELTDCVVEVLEKKEVHHHKTLMKLISWGLWWNEKALTIKQKIFTKRKNKMKNTESRFGLYHKIQRFLTLKEKRLDNNKSMLYIGKYYRGSENSENKNSEGNISFLFPARWCFAPTDPYYFSFMYDALLSKTKEEPKIIEPLITDKSKINRMEKELMEDREEKRKLNKNQTVENKPKIKNTKFKSVNMK